MTKECLDVSTGIRSGIAEQSVKCCLRLSGPVDDFLAVRSDQELRVLIEERAGEDTTTCTSWNNNGLAELEIHCRTID